MASCTKWILNIHSFTIWIKNEQLPVDHTFWWPFLRKKFHETFTLVWEAISKTRASCFIRGSKHLETIKALGLRPRAFICFSVFGTPDETLALVFDILLGKLVIKSVLNFEPVFKKFVEARRLFVATHSIRINSRRPGIKYAPLFGQRRERSRKIMAASTGFSCRVATVLVSFYRSLICRNTWAIKYGQEPMSMSMQLH